MRRFSVIVLLALLVSAPAFAQSAVSSWLQPNAAQKWIGRRVSQIKVFGNRKVNKAAILNMLVTKVGDTIEPAKIREDVRKMWRVRYFSDIVVEIDEGEGDSVVLTYLVEEKPSVRRILFSGNDNVSIGDINGKIEGELNFKDEILDMSRVKKLQTTIKELYEEKGYYLAELDYEIRGANESEVDVVYNVKEGKEVEIRGVRFVGNRDITDEELGAIIATRSKGVLSFLTDSGKFKEKELNTDLTRLQAYYFDKGHVTVNIGTPKLELSSDKEDLYVSIPISEGPVYSVSDISFKGDLVGKVENYNRRLGLKKGDVFSRSKVGLGIERITNFYKDRGYANAEVRMRHRPKEDEKKVALDFEITQGKKVYIERINIFNNTKTRDKVIRREMNIHEGDLYNQTDIEISKRRVLSLGFFERADINTSKGSSEEFIQLNVEVTERATGSFQIGAGFSSVENFIAQAQIRQQNFLGRGQTIGIQAQISSLRQLVLLSFLEPRFMDSWWTFGVNIYNQSQGFGTFTRDALGGSVTLGYPITYNLRTFLTYKLEEVGVSTGSSGFTSFGGVRTPIEAQSVANLFRGGVTSSLRLQLSYDTRNDRVIRATDGWFNTAFVEVADTATASENVFFRYGARVRSYRPIFGDFILRNNVEVGVTTSRDPLGVPIIERYLLGGIFDIRGFAPRSLGPILRVSRPGQVGQPLGSLPLGGNLQIITQTEVEFPIFKEVKIFGVVFLDVGNAYNLEDRYCSGSGGGNVSPKVDPCFSFPNSITQGLRYSTGFGIRWISPIGPLRFEWGIPLDRQPGEDPVVFEFTIGNSF